MNDAFTLLCVWVQGQEKKRRYGPRYIERLHSMVRRHTTKPFRMVCLTNRPKKVPECAQAIEIPYPGTKFTPLRGWWAKPRIFDPDLPLQGRVLYSDLDVLLVGDLDPIVDFPADFAIAPDKAPTFQGKGERKTVKGYNSSIIAFDAGARPELWRDWTPAVASKLWGDQDWIKQRSPDERTFPGEWFTRLQTTAKWGPDCKVVLCIKHKNHEATRKYPWFAEYWR